MVSRKDVFPRSHPEIAEDLKKFGCYQRPDFATHCVSFKDAKKAALLFERVYFDEYDYLTHLMANDWQPKDTWEVDKINTVFPSYSQIPHPEIVFLDSKISHKQTFYLEKDIYGHPIMNNYFETYEEVIINLFKDGGLKAVPLLRDDSVITDSSDDNNTSVWSLILSEIKSPDINKASWAEILEFRKDTLSVNDYRMIRKLYERLLKCRSQVQIADEIGLALEKYEVACKKHGFDLIQSNLQLLYKKETLIASGLGAGISSLSGFSDSSALLGLLAGGLAVGSQVALNFHETKINKKQLILSDSSEAGIIYKINNKFKTEH